MFRSQRQSNPILQDQLTLAKPKGIRTYQKKDNLSTHQDERPLQTRTPNRHRIPDHSYEFFHPYQADRVDRPLSKSPATFQPRLEKIDPLSRKISNIYASPHTARKPTKERQNSPQLNASARRVMDNKSQLGDSSPYDDSRGGKKKTEAYPSDVNWFLVDTIKHRHDYHIKQQDAIRSTALDQRSSLDPRVPVGQQNQQKLHLRAVKKSELLWRQ